MLRHLRSVRAVELGAPLSADAGYWPTYRSLSESMNALAIMRLLTIHGRPKG